MDIIEVDHLTKFYGKSRGIIDVTFQVEEGEIFGFIGPNGAGKTTTIRTLLGLIFPTSGSARIFGKDVVRDGPEIRRYVGYLPSEVFYYEGMKVGDLLRYAAGFYPGDHTQRIAELADYMGLDLDRKVDELSYGNKKKVGIVQGLLASPQTSVPGRTHAGARPPDAAQVLRPDSEGESGKRRHRVLLLPHPQRSAAPLQPGRHHPGRPHRGDFRHPHLAAEQLQENHRDRRETDARR